MVLATGNVLFKDDWKSTGTTFHSGFKIFHPNLAEIKIKSTASSHTAKLYQNFIPGHIDILLPKSACRERIGEGNDSYHRNHVSNLMEYASSQDIIPTKFDFKLDVNFSQFLNHAETGLT